jgi:hypothetical protein
MTEEQKKEMISKEYLRILAFGHGFKVIDLPLDHGVDMMVCPVIPRLYPDGRTRYLDGPHKLEFQLKATTPNGIISDADAIRYDLEVKNYNDLVTRRSDPLPLHLVLVVLDHAPPVCLSWSIEHLALAGCAYWYIPEEEAALSSNQHTVRIKIPKANRIGLDFVRERFECFGVDV